MHLLKIVGLVTLTLATMRAVSWSFLWLLSRTWKRNSLYTRLVANVLALSVFSAFLMVDSVPGELLDLQALAFGVIVFGVFFGVDGWWLPGCLRGRIQTRDVSRSANRQRQVGESGRRTRG